MTAGTSSGRSDPWAAPAPASLPAASGSRAPLPTGSGVWAAPGSATTGPLARVGGDPPLGGSGSAVTRVSVHAPRTRVDVALPADLPLVELVPVLLDMAEESPGGAGEWTLAPLGYGPADAEASLAELGVLDGDQLVLRPAPDAADPPLYDDVADALAELTPPAFRTWDRPVARRLATAAGGVALVAVLAALVRLGRGPGTLHGLVPALLAGGAAVAATVGGAVLARRGAAPRATGGLLCAGVAFGAGCATVAVPGPLVGAHLLAGGGVGAGLAAAGVAAGRPGGRWAPAALVGLATAGTVGAVTGLVTLVAELLAPPDGGPDAAAVAAGAGAAALVASAAVPRLGVAVAGLRGAGLDEPDPGDDEPDGAEPEPAASATEVERGADRAHTAVSGMLAGLGLVVAAAGTVLAAAPGPGWRGAAGWALAALLVLLLAARSRTYANAVQATLLLLGAVVSTTGVLGAVLWTRPSPVGGYVVVAVGLAVAATAGVLGAGAGRHRSPVLRRAADLAEAVGIAAVVPLALAVMDLYTVLRLR